MIAVIPGDQREPTAKLIGLHHRHPHPIQAMAFARQGLVPLRLASRRALNSVPDFHSGYLVPWATR